MKFKRLALFNSAIQLYPIIAMVIQATSPRTSFAIYPLESNGMVFSWYWLSIIATATLSQTFAIFLFFRIKNESGKEYKSLFLASGFVIFPISIFVKKRLNLKFKRSKYKWLILISFPLFILAVLTPLTVIADKNKFDKPAYEHYHEAPQFSLDVNKPNYIEVFIDGLDYSYFKNSVAGSPSEYSDFTFYTKFLTAGFTTSTSFPVEFRGDYYWKKGINNGNQFQYKFNPKSLDKNAFDTTKFPQENYYSNLGPHKPNNYSETFSTDSKLVDKEIPMDVNVVNGEMGNILLGKATDVYVPTISPYKAFIKTAKISESNTPSYSFLSDHITHPPIFTGSNGRASKFMSVQDSYDIASKFIINLKHKLQSIKSTGLNSTTAWDNTTLMIYGDHSTHAMSRPGVGRNFDGYKARKNNSLLLVKPLKKYIKQNRKEPEISKREVYARFTQYIGDQIKLGNDPIDFINTNKNFDEGGMFATKFFPTSNSEYMVTKFVDGVVTCVPDGELNKLGAMSAKNGTISNTDYRKYIDKEVMWK